MAVTGIFFYYQDGERLRDFPEALEGILSLNNVYFYDAFYPQKPPSSFDLEPIPIELIYKVHSREMVERVKRSHAFEGAKFSVAGTVAAAVRIWKGEITNAFVFTGYGDHHAGSYFFGGGCYFNGAAIAIQELREHFQAKKFAIIDTDAHHGDGTWQIFEADSDVLYVCFCPAPSQQNNNKINVQIPQRVTDEDYLELVASRFLPLVNSFQPEAIFWNWGYDGTQGEYGDIGLTPHLHIELACRLRNISEEACHGRLVVILCGGARRDLACYLIPRIIRVLAK
jgi:acetoin utilization deacetylase AcuC-like enzyme